jgi:phosphoglycerate dehydrogenase-like enzyme
MPLHDEKVLSLPTPSHIRWMFRPTDWQALQSEFDELENLHERQMTPEEVLEKIADSGAVLAGWSSPTFLRQTLDSAPHLKRVAHTVGSVKGLFSLLQVA